MVTTSTCKNTCHANWRTVWILNKLHQWVFEMRNYGQTTTSSHNLWESSIKHHDLTNGSNRKHGSREYESASSHILWPSKIDTGLEVQFAYLTPDLTNILYQCIVLWHQADILSLLRSMTTTRNSSCLTVSLYDTSTVDLDGFLLVSQMKIWSLADDLHASVAYFLGDHSGSTWLSDNDTTFSKLQENL